MYQELELSIRLNMIILSYKLCKHLLNCPTDQRGLA